MKLCSINMIWNISYWMMRIRSDTFSFQFFCPFPLNWSIQKSWNLFSISILSDSVAFLSHNLFLSAESILNMLEYVNYALYNDCVWKCYYTWSNAIFMIHLTHNRLASSPRYFMISISSCHIMWILSRWSGVIIVTLYNHELIVITVYPKKQNIFTAYNLMRMPTIYCYTNNA